MMAKTPAGSPGRSIRVAIIDDHALIRLGMKDLLAHEPGFEVCGEAAEMTEALRMVDGAKPDVVIADLSLGGASGLEMIKQIKARHGTVKIVVSSVQDETLFAERALRAGAMGYVMKEKAPEELIGAIREVMKGRIALSPRMAERVLRHAFAGGKSADEPLASRLSDREMEVFQLIGQGLPARDIAKRLHLSVKTVETHRENLKHKLNVDNAAELVRQATLWTLEGN